MPYKAIFCGDIHLHRPYIGLIYGRHLHFRILKFPLTHGLPKGMSHEGLASNMQEYLP